MKKLIRIFVIVFAIALSIISHSRKVTAEEDLYIPDWKVEAHLLENGDLQISEDITFEFNEEFNGVYRDIMLDKTSGVSQIKVQEQSGEGFSEYSQVEAADNGDQGVFTIKVDDDKALIKIYSPSEDEKKIFRISYIVNNVAIRYNDTGELYYKFLGNENKTSVGRFTIMLHLPQADTDNKVKVFAHGPSNGRIIRKSDTLYQMQVNTVPSNTFIEGRILFPRDFIALSSNNQKLDKYSAIIEEEASFRQKQEEERERKEAFRKLMSTITLCSSGFALAIFVIILYQCRRKISDITNQGSEIPQDCTPAIASLITGTIAGSNTIFATILNLFRKGFLRIQEEFTDISGNQSFVMYKTKDADNTLLSHESFLIRFLFHDMGNGSSVSIQDIKHFSKHHNAEFVKKYMGWKNKIKSDAVQNGYYDKSKKKQGTLLIILSLIILALGIITAIAGSGFAVIGILIAIPLLIYGAFLFYRLTDFGYDQSRRWINFIKYMKKHYTDLSEEEVINTLDLSLIYALSLNAVKKQKNVSQEAYSMNSWIFWYILFMNSNNNVFRDDFNKSFEAIGVSQDSSGNFSGGGFSAGGGGGAGGGGAGGF